MKLERDIERKSCSTEREQRERQRVALEREREREREPRETESCNRQIPKRKRDVPERELSELRENKISEHVKNQHWSCTKSEEYNHEMVECLNNGFKMFRDYASVISPYYNWSEIDVAGVWEVLNMGGMAHHSLVHAARRKDKDMDLLMDL
ncbi:unnamed protein product [Prunus armeniaca]